MNNACINEYQCKQPWMYSAEGQHFPHCGSPHNFGETVGSFASNCPKNTKVSSWQGWNNSPFFGVSFNGTSACPGTLSEEGSRPGPCLPPFWSPQRPPPFLLFSSILFLKGAFCLVMTCLLLSWVSFEVNYTRWHCFFSCLTPGCSLSLFGPGSVLPGK